MEGAIETIGYLFRYQSVFRTKRSNQAYHGISYQRQTRQSDYLFRPIGYFREHSCEMERHRRI